MAELIKIYDEKCMEATKSVRYDYDTDIYGIFVQEWKKTSIFERIPQFKRCTSCMFTLTFIYVPDSAELQQHLRTLFRPLKLLLEEYVASPDFPYNTPLNKYALRRDGLRFKNEIRAAQYQIITPYLKDVGVLRAMFGPMFEPDVQRAKDQLFMQEELKRFKREQAEQDAYCLKLKRNTFYNDMVSYLKEHPECISVDIRQRTVTFKWNTDPTRTFYTDHIGTFITLDDGFLVTLKV